MRFREKNNQCKTLWRIVDKCTKEVVYTLPIKAEEEYTVIYQTVATFASSGAVAFSSLSLDVDGRG